MTRNPNVNWPASKNHPGQMIRNKTYIRTVIQDKSHYRRHIMYVYSSKSLTNCAKDTQRPIIVIPDPARRSYKGPVYKCVPCAF